jgi:hypothetical protein
MASSALHWIRSVRVAGPIRVGHFVGTSVAVGSFVNRLRRSAVTPTRWGPRHPRSESNSELVHIES